jgi:hypothetical protein
MGTAKAWRSLAEVEREHVLDTLRHTKGDWTSAAGLLGVSIERLQIILKENTAESFRIRELKQANISGLSSSRNPGALRKKPSKTANSVTRRHERQNYDGSDFSSSRAKSSKEAVIGGLPGSNTLRWVPSRKAFIVLAVKNKLLSTEEACCRYNISSEELANWKSQLDRYGLPGLRAGKLQLYRRSVLAG